MIQDASFKELIPCTNIWMKILKERLFQLDEQNKLKKSLQLKTDDTITPQGVICDIWSKITGKGEWRSDHSFCYETASGGRAFVHHSAPHNVLCTFGSKGLKCKISQFLANDSANNPEDYLEIFDHLGEYPKPKEKVEQEPSGLWKITANVMHENKTVGYRSVEVIGNTVQEATSRFQKDWPNLKLKSIFFLGKTVF